jgi:ribosomal-protein-alanine N-acetyltransferase
MSDALQVAIRGMEAADLPRILEIAAEARNAPHWPESAYRHALTMETSPARVALVAVETGTGELTGFAVCSLVAGEAELESIVVASAWQGRGIGRRLLAEAMERLRSAGTHEVFLEVRASNEAALRLYRHFGFTETGRRSGYYSDPAEDGITMRLRLDGEASTGRL